MSMTRGYSSDSILLERLHKGDMRAYEEIFTKFYPSLCAYGSLYVKDREAVENIVQDLMLRLWEQHSTLEISGNLSGYLFTAVRNRSMHHISHMSVRERALDIIGKTLSETLDVPDYYAAKELEQHIHKAIEALPETFRQAFELNRFEDKTYGEIASQLGVSVQTVAYRIQQALRLLRISLKDWLPVIAFVLGSKFI